MQRGLSRIMPEHVAHWKRLNVKYQRKKTAHAGIGRNRLWRPSSPPPHNALTMKRFPEVTVCRRFRGSVGDWADRDLTRRKQSAADLAAVSACQMALSGCRVARQMLDLTSSGLGAEAVPTQEWAAAVGGFAEGWPPMRRSRRQGCRLPRCGRSRSGCRIADRAEGLSGCRSLDWPRSPSGRPG